MSIILALLMTFAYADQTAVQNLFAVIQGCGQNLAPDRGTLTVGSGLVTDFFRDEFIQNYPGLSASESDGQVTFDLKALDATALEDILADVAFLKINPGTPLENLGSSLRNYDPKNDSQKKLLQSARQLVTYKGGRAAGLVLTGEPGTGKTHMAVAIAKEFLRAGETPLFIKPGSQPPSKDSIKRHRVFVIDDLNSGFGPTVDIFLSVVSQLHDSGGKLLMTSNQPFEKTMQDAIGPYSLRKDEGPRLRDRMKNMFLFLNIEGESQRDAGAWFND